jgi:hypothetical protein
MKRLLLAFLLLTCSEVWATDITYTDKETGGAFTAADANEIKTATNSKDDKQPSTLALTTDTSISEAQILANKYITNQGASSEIDNTLPALSYHISKIIVVEEEQIIETCPPSGEAFDLSGTILDANDCVDSPAVVGTKAVITRKQNASGTWLWSWDVVRGTWSDTGASD